MPAMWKTILIGSEQSDSLASLFSLRL